MVEIVGLTLILTRRCNAYCRHCGFASGPSAGDTMNFAQAKNYIAEAASFDSVQAISITGGEPFLYQELVVEILSYAQQFGLWSEIVTNSYWAESYAGAILTLERLRAHGLRNFVTSLDAFHAEFVPPERVRNAIRAAIDLGLQVTVKILPERDESFSDAWVRNFLSISDLDQNVKVARGVTMMTGRAKKSECRDKTGLPEDISGFCDKAIRFPAVNARGLVYCCCGFGERARVAGCTADTPLRSILKEMQGNLLFNLIAGAGPAAVLAKAAPGYCGKFASPCEICNAFYDNGRIHKAVAIMLREIADGEIFGSHPTLSNS